MSSICMETINLPESMHENCSCKEEIHIGTLKDEGRWHDPNHTYSHDTLHLPVLRCKQQMIFALFLFCN